MMRTTSGLIAVAGWLLALAVVADEPPRPNVLVILTDDQGYGDLGCYGGEDLTTPVLDQLAADGVRFTQFYAAAPVCSPSRAGLLTGRVPQRAGQPGNASSQRGVAGMPTEQITMAEMFREAGYATAHLGKWHLGFTPETMPRGQGFQYSFGHMGGCIDNYSHFFYWQGPNRHDLWRNGQEVWHDGEYFLDLVADEFAKWVRQPRDEPWLVYVALNTPHYPLQGTAKWREHYHDLPSPRREYAAFVSTTDEVIGRLLADIDTLGQRENTIVVFQSDHGHSTEERTFGGGGSAGPFRGAKFSLFEGGLRVPAIIRWPKQVPAGVHRDQLATSCDWLPTLLDLCGLEPPKHIVDGKSLTAVLASDEAESPHEWFAWESGRSPQGPQWAVRRGPWKLLAHPRDTTEPEKRLPLDPQRDRRFLANLADNPGETTNRAAEHPELVAELEALYTRWSREVQDTSVRPQ